jgi:hypothetical protein
MAKSTFRMRGRSNRLGAAEVISPQLHRSVVVQVLLALWRWSIEITLTVTLLVVWFHLAAVMPNYAVAMVMAFPLVAASNFGWGRRLVGGWVFVLFTRHRLRTALVQLGARNRSGKLPWLVWYRPTPVGERITLLLVAGMSAAQIEEAAPALAAACWARQVRVDTHRRMTSFVTVDVIRRDPLDSPKPITSRLMAKLGRTEHPTVLANTTTDPATSGFGFGYGSGAYGAARVYRADGTPAEPPADNTNPNKPKRPPRDDGPDDGGLSEYV